MFAGTGRLSACPNAIAPDRRLNGFTIDKHKRFWQVLDPKGQLVCLTVYKRGAKEVVRRLSE